MEIWDYTRNSFIETIYPITVWGTFVSGINSWRKQLAEAKERASELTHELILAKIELTEAFQNEPHSVHVRWKKRNYHRLKRMWKEASTNVVRYRYLMKCEQRAFERFKTFYPESLMQEDLIKNHHYKKSRR